MKRFDVIQAWLDNVAYSHSRNESTPYHYRQDFKRFCEFVGKTPQQILEEYQGMTDREFRRMYAQYLRAFISELGSSEYAPGSVKAKVTAVRSFFKYNDLPLGYVPVARQKVMFHNRDISKEEIEEILKSSRPRDAAFYCVMAQSGLRPDTLCKVRRKHIEPDFSEGVMPCKIEVPQKLAKGEYGEYFTFMGQESIKYLKAYLNVRRSIKPEDHLFTSHGFDKPLNRRSMSSIFARTIDKLKAAGVMSFEHEEEGKPREVRLYNLRKFFRKQAGHAGSDYVNFWMGHSLGVDEHYFSRDPEHHRRIYREQAMPHLRLETATPSETEQQINELREKLERRDSEIEDLKAKLNGQANLQTRVETLEKSLKELKKLLQESPN